MGNNKYKILIVEDDRSISNFLETMLQAGGYQVILAASGSQGKMLFASHQPDLVVLDLGLPDMDGMELLKTIRLSSSTPIIILSIIRSCRLFHGPTKHVRIFVNFQECL